MHPDDRAALGAFMDEGVPTWQAWIGTRTGAADYLSPRGLEIFDALHRQIPEFFGSGWLAKAIGPDRRVPEARILSPVLTHSDPVEQFATLLRIWTVAQLAARGRMEGLERVRRTLRTNVSTSRFLHTLLQMELAGAGVHLGARVELEPAKAGGPGDLVLQTSDTSVFIEVTTLATDQQFTDSERAFDRQAAVLRGLETRFKVSFEGALPGRVADDAEQAWQEQAENAARAAAAIGDEVSVQDPPNEEGLTVRPDTGRLGLRLSGPHMEVDTARRMLGAYDRKARQTQAAGTAWIVLLDHNDSMKLTPFGRASLAEKVGQLHDLTKDLLARHPHVAGIVWTRTIRAVTPPNPAAADTREGTGILRALPGSRLRETVIIPRRIVVPHQTRLMAGLFAREAGWLDGALEVLGHPGGLAGLLRSPSPAALPAQGTRLWTPRQRG